jgi:hypothetical protein
VRDVNVFQAPGSFGSYVYDEPSRFQYVFWPATTDRFLYTCKTCRLTAYMGDFEEIPGEKVPALKAMLEGDAVLEGELTPYYEIPMTLRLPIAEKVYQLLGLIGICIVALNGDDTNAYQFTVSTRSTL